MINAVGSSHLRSRLARWMARIILNSTDIISVRDELSKRTLSECTEKEIILGRDPAFLLTPKPSEKARKIIDSWPTGKKILVSLTEHIFINKNLLGCKDMLNRFLEQISEFADANGYSILTYVNYTDQAFAEKIKELCNKSAVTMLQGQNHLLPEELIHLFSKIDCVIASQMHVCIFAYLAAVPFVSVVYDDKVAEFNKRVGNPNYLHPAEIDNSLKVAKVLATAANSKPTAQDPSIQNESEQLIEMLINFVHG